MSALAERLHTRFLGTERHKESKPSHKRDGNVIYLTDILPFSLKFKMQYGQPYGLSETLSLAANPSYDIMAPYFAVKALDGSPAEQRTMLERVSNALVNRESLTDVIRDTAASLPADTLQPVSPEKMGRVSRWSPTLVKERAVEVAQAAKEKDETPVIIGYSGIMALSPVLDAIEIGNTAHFVIDTRLTSDTPAGYVLKKTEHGIDVDFLSPGDIKSTEAVAIIDDAIHSGETMDAVTELYSHASVSKSPLFRT